MGLKSQSSAGLTKTLMSFLSGVLTGIEIKGLNQLDGFMFFQMFFLLIMFPRIFAQKDTMIKKITKLLKQDLFISSVNILLTKLNIN
jgi:hypothetical protein